MRDFCYGFLQRRAKRNRPIDWPALSSADVPHRHLQPFSLLLTITNLTFQSDANASGQAAAN
jgi:hypothetical protein